jgi:hypothetical protein
VNLEKRTGLSFTCGNAGVNAYGTSNMAARLEYTTITNEQAVVVTLIYPDLLRGLRDLDGEHFFSSKPKGPLPALWEAGTILLVGLTYRLRHHDRTHQEEGSRQVAERSLRRLLDAVKQREKEGKAVLIVLSPLRSEIGGKESEYTRLAEQLVLEYRLPLLNMNTLVTQAYSDSMYTDEKHLGLPGHRLYATAIAERLSAHLPGASRAGAAPSPKPEPSGTD